MAAQLRGAGAQRQGRGLHLGAVAAGDHGRAEETVEAELLEKLENTKKSILERVNKLVGKSSKISSVEVMEEPFEKTATLKIRRFLYKKSNSPKKDKETEGK